MLIYAKYICLKNFFGSFRFKRGFTLMELMVVIVIVAILAAVAVPLYINYVRDAQRTEARGAIGAIITAQQAFYQKSGIAGTPAYAADLAALKAAGQLDLSRKEDVLCVGTPTNLLVYVSGFIFSLLL